MSSRRPLAAAAAALTALALAATAGAACPSRPLDALARDAQVVVTAKAQQGPLARNGIGLLSPAAFRVVAYDQGSGPGSIRVRTALADDAGALAITADGVNPVPGQTWHLWGTFDSNGVLQTSACAGSALVGAQLPPSLGAGLRSTTLRAASFAGVARGGGPLPMVTLAPGGRVELRLPAREANYPVSPALARSIVAVRMMRAGATTTLPVRWNARDGVLSTRVSAPASGTATLVVITRAAAYAARLRAA